jgi:LmbE family N-acetylglucosaminyl deacetylase
MEFIDFKLLRRSFSIDLLYPGWKERERIAFLSPHDDDVILGAGYLLIASQLEGGVPCVFIFSRGDAGYSTPEEKESIVERRKVEAIRAYGLLGVREDNIFFFNFPDLSLMSYVNRELLGEKGLLDRLIQTLREKRFSKVVFSSGHYENWDHTAIFYTGMYCAPQAGDSILGDLGPVHPIKSYLVYSVWGDFEPTKTESDEIRADVGILVDEEQEEAVMRAAKAFSSQKKIIGDMVAQRKKRKSKEGYLELYQRPKVRKPIDFEAYFRVLRKCK